MDRTGSWGGGGAREGEEDPNAGPVPWWCWEFSHVRLFMTPWTTACQAPLSTQFPKQEYWSGLPFPPPRGFPHSGIKPTSLALSGRFFTTELSRKSPVPWGSCVVTRWPKEETTGCISVTYCGLCRHFIGLCRCPRELSKRHHTSQQPRVTSSGTCDPQTQGWKKGKTA